eukprot:3905050-Prymnesium_polylepis.1
MGWRERRRMRGWSHLPHVLLPIGDLEILPDDLIRLGRRRDSHGAAARSDPESSELLGIMVQSTRVASRAGWRRRTTPRMFKTKTAGHHGVVEQTAGLRHGTATAQEVAMDKPHPSLARLVSNLGFSVPM